MVSRANSIITHLNYSVKQEQDAISTCVSSSDDSVELIHMTSPEFKQAVNEDVILFLPFGGAIEQHGPHMPLSTDMLLAKAVVIDVAEDVRKQSGARVVVAPGFSYGYKSQTKSGAGEYYYGTTSIDASTFIAMVRDIIRQFAVQGVRRFVVANHHFENQMLQIEGIDLALRDLKALRNEHGGRLKTQKIIRVDVWELVEEETVTKVWGDDFPGWATEHAGVMETSLMLHYFPDLVHMDRLPRDNLTVFPAYEIHPQPDPYISDWVPASGVLAPASKSSASKGKLFANDLRENMTKLIIKEFNLMPTPTN